MAIHKDREREYSEFVRDCEEQVHDSVDELKSLERELERQERITAEL